MNGSDGRTSCLEAELTWTGESFERRVRVEVDGDGRIAGVGPARGGDGQPSLTRLDRRALLPGFVNAHSHAFQRGLRGRGETFPAGAGDFWSWRDAMYALAGGLDGERFSALCRQAFSEMRDAGITTVGEFHYLHHLDPEAADFELDRLVLEAAAAVGIRIVLLEAFYATGGVGPGGTPQRLAGAQRRFRIDDPERYWRQMDRLAGALDPATQSLGAVAHSIRAAPPELVREIYIEARRRDLVFHMHVEEQRQEIEACQNAYGARPMALLAERLGGFAGFTAVHCTHTLPEDLAAFAAGGGVACLCPLTEANLGDGIADLGALVEAGGRVALGSDSNARISMLEECRWLEYVQRLAGERRGALRDAAGRIDRPLLAAATVDGARALGVDAGEIRIGAWADLVAVDLDCPGLAGCDEDSLLAALLLGAADDAIVATAVGGRWRERRGAARSS